MGRINSPLGQLVQGLALEEHLVFDKTQYEGVVSVRNHPGFYARCLIKTPGSVNLGWIGGKGFGNLLMVGVLQEMIRLDCDILTLHPSPSPGSSLQSLERFYSQYGLSRDKELSRDRGTRIMSGKPFQYPQTHTVVNRVLQRYFFNMEQ